MVIPYKPGRCITDEKKQVAFMPPAFLFNVDFIRVLRSAFSVLP
jgi:hypothetical protein